MEKPDAAAHIEVDSSIFSGEKIKAHEPQVVGNVQLLGNDNEVVLVPTPSPDPKGR
jgi:hypothetical protein